MKQEFKYLRAVNVTMGPYFLYKILSITSFIFSEINTIGLPKLSKISFAFNIFIPVPVQEMVCLKQGCGVGVGVEESESEGFST